MGKMTSRAGRQAVARRGDNEIQMIRTLEDLANVVALLGIGRIGRVLLGALREGFVADDSCGLVLDSVFDDAAERRIGGSSEKGYNEKA